MKKNNENGFVLAEAIISAVFIMGIFTFLISNVFPLIYKYDRALNYDNPEDVYLVNLFVDTLTELNCNVSLDASNVKFSDNIGINNLITETSKTDYYQKLISKNYLNITDVLFINGNTSIANINSNGMTRGMREYAKYFIERKDSSKDKITDIAVLVRFGNAKYAGLWWK